MTSGILGPSLPPLISSADSMAVPGPEQQPIASLGLGATLLTHAELDYFDPNTWMLDNLVDFPYGPSGFPVIEQHV